MKSNKFVLFLLRGQPTPAVLKKVYNVRVPYIRNVSYIIACVLVHKYARSTDISAARPYDCLEAQTDGSVRNVKQATSVHSLSCVVSRLCRLTAEV